jgi:hypothetical protein
VGVAADVVALQGTDGTTCPHDLVPSPKAVLESGWHPRGGEQAGDVDAQTPVSDAEYVVTEGGLAARPGGPSAWRPRGDAECERRGPSPPAPRLHEPNLGVAVAAAGQGGGRQEADDGGRICEDRERGELAVSRDLRPVVAALKRRRGMPRLGEEPVGR